MDGYIQTGIGILVSLVLFIIGYRQTIGAKKERAKNANDSIVRTMMRRMVLEDYAPVYKDISRIIEGKAREFQVSSNSLLSVDEILNSVYTEVFDSDLIAPSQRIEIEERLNIVFDKIEKEPVRSTLSEFQQLKLEKISNKESVWAMVVSTSFVGALTSTIYSIFKAKSFEVDLFMPSLLMPSLGVLVGSIMVITALVAYKRSKEFDLLPSISSAGLASSDFEADIAKILVKSGFKFLIEPSINDSRPDFLVNVNGRKVAIEAKSWHGPVPLHLLRRTAENLQKLVSMEEIDEVILVTKKRDDIPFGAFDNENISVLTINELASKLKNAA